MSVTLPTEYQVYDNIFMKDDNFIFTIHHVPIVIPTSSYFFDTWNTKTEITISGEISVGTGKIEKNHKKVIALTFDDGPSPKYTNILLDILKKENVKATFYVL
jgi:peptidoglycan/xylan/chitin deacetylase (PgdA/CDA1 family)